MFSFFISEPNALLPFVFFFRRGTVWEQVLEKEAYKMQLEVPIDSFSNPLVKCLACL